MCLELDKEEMFEEGKLEEEEEEEKKICLELDKEEMCEGGYMKEEEEEEVFVGGRGEEALCRCIRGGRGALGRRKSHLVEV